MADIDPPATDTPAKKPVRRRSTTPAKAAAATRTRTPRAKPEPTAETPAPAKPAKAPPKPRSSKRTASPARKTTGCKKVETATEKVGGKWGIAAIAGGLAAAGVATAALLSLRSSSAKPGDPASPKPTKAHQPDGTDASKSFEAGIADENTIPD